MLADKIHVFDPASGDHSTWATPEMVTSIGLTKIGGYVVGLKSSVAFWDGVDGFHHLARIESDDPETRLNEGVVGPDGWFWVGTMQNNVDNNYYPIEQTRKCGRLYRVSPEGDVNLVCCDIFWLPNTFAWTDGQFIVGDTVDNTLFSYSWNVKSGLTSGRRVFFERYSRGLPDGSCVDSDGNIWNARVLGGKCLVQLSPSGQFIRTLDVPCTWPTCCVFGGDDLRTLYIASARFTLPTEHLRKMPWEGNLFKVTLGMVGRLHFRFGRVQNLSHILSSDGSVC